MGKVIYDDRECEVLSVETQWDYGFYNGARVRKPMDTWLLINSNGYLHWVNMISCSGIE